MREIVFKAMPSNLDTCMLDIEDEAELAVVLDTIKNGTKVYVEIEGRAFMLRDTALISICDRLRISGEVLNDIPAELLDTHLNNYAS